MKAKPPGGPRHCAMHCHRPLKFAPCADAPDAAKVADSTIAVNRPFMIFTPLQSDWTSFAGR
jgi:hypothetical protein